MRAQLQTQAKEQVKSSFMPATNGLLQRKCACGGPTGECAECSKEKRLGLQPKLKINKPGDIYEQQADRVAEAVINGKTTGRPPISSLGRGSAVQRQEPAKPKTEEEKYQEAAKKVGEAFLETAPGKEIKEKAEELGDAFIATLPGKIITGAGVAGAIATLAATHKELPIGIPEIPLDRIKPGLRMKITYEGPVDKPTKAMATFSFTLGGARASEKRPALTESERFRAETARMAAEQAKFREGLKTDEERAAEKRMFDAYLRSRMLSPEQLTPRTQPLSFGVAGEQLGFTPLTPPGRALGPWPPHFKLTSEAPATESATREEPKKKEEEPLQRKAAGDREMSATPPVVDEVLQSSGQPLDTTTRAFMEQRFGHDFSQVRVHTDTQAAESARVVNALAYTVGQDVVFGARQYAPDTASGRMLLAHELSHVVQQSSGRTQGLRLQRWSWAEIKEKAYGGMISGIHKARDGMRNGLKRVAATHLPAHLYPVADNIIEIAVTVVEVIITVIMAVLGIVVGFSEGIVGMIEGLFTLAYGIVKILYDLIAGIFTNFDAAKQDLVAVWTALRGLPAALKKLVTDWLDKFGKASSERQSLMIGELTGQVLAIIATFALAAGRAGSAAKTAATTAEAATEAAATTTAVDVAATTTARAKPVLTVIEGGGGRAGSVGTRAVAGASDIEGNVALKVAPELKPSPVRLVPPVPAEAAPAVAPVTAPVALAPSTSQAVAAGVGVTAATAARTAPRETDRPRCDDPTGLTKADPIPMTWYKVREDDYYPKRLTVQGQVYGRDDPSNPRKLPRGEPLGVPNRYWPRPNKILQLLPGERGSKAADFRAVLIRYGFDWSGLQADHVQDLDWGGPDAFENLWPLSDAANLSAGPRQNSNQKITYCETPEGPRVVTQPLGDFKLSPRHYGRYFRIARVER